jgi:hypothetical protein
MFFLGHISMDSAKGGHAQLVGFTGIFLCPEASFLGLVGEEI